MKIFVIDWSTESTTELVGLCKEAGHMVAFELKDGAEAYKKILAFMPDKILVNYQTKPSHGRITAEQVKKRKSTAHIPIFFIEGSLQNNEKVTLAGECVSRQGLLPLLGEKA